MFDVKTFIIIDKMTFSKTFIKKVKNFICFIKITKYVLC